MTYPFEEKEIFYLHLREIIAGVHALDALNQLALFGDLKARGEMTILLGAQ